MSAAQPADETAEIRLGTPSDAEGLAVLWRETGLGDWTAESIGRDLAELTIRNPDLVLVACDGAGRIVGSVIGGYDGRRGWVNRLGVDPEWQRSGLGPALMRRLEAAFVAKGCPKVNLLVRQGNERVVPFYESLGFRSDPMIFMEKWLDVP